MKNIIILLSIFISNSYGRSLFEQKLENFQFNIKNYEALISLDSETEFCKNIKSTIPKLYIILEQDRDLINFLVKTGDIVDYDYAGTINDNKLSNLFYYLNMNDLCDEQLLNINTVDEYLKTSIINGQFLEMEFSFFARSRGHLSS